MNYKMANKADKFLARLIGNYIKLLNTAQRVSLNSAILSLRTTLILIDNNELSYIGSQLLELASETDYESATDAMYDETYTFEPHKHKELVKILMLNQKCRMIIGEDIDNEIEEYE